MYQNFSNVFYRLINLSYGFGKNDPVNSDRLLLKNGNPAGKRQVSVFVARSALYIVN